MTWNPPALLEVKFACPHCGQHIACDPAYCGLAINCPSCRSPMTVPLVLAFASKSLDRSSTPPPGEEDGGHLRDGRTDRPAPVETSGHLALQSWFWFFFLGPLLLFFAGGGFEFRWLPETTLIFLLAVGAVVSGFLLARITSSSLTGFVATGVLFSALIIAADAFVCYFGGCAMSCSQMAARGI